MPLDSGCTFAAFTIVKRIGGGASVQIWCPGSPQGHADRRD
jgi:hypothetical protein